MRFKSDKQRKAVMASLRKLRAMPSTRRPIKFRTEKDSGLKDKIRGEISVWWHPSQGYVVDKWVSIDDKKEGFTKLVVLNRKEIWKKPKTVQTKLAIAQVEVEETMKRL